MPLGIINKGHEQRYECQRNDDNIVTWEMSSIKLRFPNNFGEFKGLSPSPLNKKADERPLFRFFCEGKKWGLTTDTNQG